MNVGELRDRVAYALVDAAADVAALDMRDGLVQVGGCHRDRELLEAVSRNHHHIRIDRSETVGELERGQTRGLGHRHMITTFDHVEQRRRNREAARFDVVRDVPAVLVEQDRSAEHQLKFNRRMAVQLPDQQLAAPVVGAVGDRKTNAALVTARHFPTRGRKQCVHGQTRVGSWLTTMVFHSQYTSSASVPGSRKPLPEFFTPPKGMCGPAPYVGPLMDTSPARYLAMNCSMRLLL